MQLWHLTEDAPRTPHRVSPGERAQLVVGTWPIEEGQSVSVSLRIDRATGAREELRLGARWQKNSGNNSYWVLDIGPFERGDRVRYEVEGRSRQGVTTGPTGTFRVAPSIYLSLLWHQHQPIYKNTALPEQRGSYLHPWVRMHALRDYYGMADIVRAHPSVHVTFNLTPSLLWQLEDYVDNGATDRSLELLRTRKGALSSRDRDELIARFFDADLDHQISIHPRYRELFDQRAAGGAFSDQDVRDLAMWFDLSWFAKETRDGEITLATGERVSVQGLVEKGAGFTDDDVEALVAEEYKLMRGVVAIHRALQDKGQIEVSTTPFFHPILPLLVDTDRATLDRPGMSLPKRFAYPEDADAQVRRAVDYYKRLFARRPRGMWPAEGAVSQSVLPYFADARLKWIATDRGVLAKSGRHGYDVDDPDVLCRPYRAEEDGRGVSVFFRDTQLSDAIGFRYKMREPEQAAAEFVGEIKERFARRLRSSDDRVVTVIVDGENAWGGYADDGRPFLHELYRKLGEDREIETVTFAEYVDGDAERGLLHHPRSEQTRVYELFTGSWIDEAGSRAGVDLGTWIGEGEENVAWDLLGEARRALVDAGATPRTAPEAFEAMYMAEGSDWFWWFGDDQDSGRDSDFDDLFRTHLANVYRALKLPVPARLNDPIVPHGIVWNFGTGGAWARAGDVVTVRSKRAGALGFRADTGEAGTVRLTPAGGAMGYTDFFHATVGPFSAGARAVEFTFTADGDDAHSGASFPERTVTLVG